MKPTTISHLIVSLAAAASAAPGTAPPPESLFGIIPAGVSLAGGVFNSAACIAITFFLGRNNPLCGDSGSSSVTVKTDKNDDDDNDSSSSSSTKNYGYDFDYSTNKDGTLKITIKPNDGHECTSDVDADGKDLQKVIKDQAEKCFDEQ